MPVREGLMVCTGGELVGDAVTVETHRGIARPAVSRRAGAKLAGAAAFAVSFFGPVGLSHAHPGHPHFPGVSEHLPFASAGSDPAFAVTLAILGLCLGMSFIELSMVLPMLVRRLRPIRTHLILCAALAGVFLSLTLLAGCSSGGGGGGGGGAEAKRPNAPGVRILHAGLDIEPVRLNSPLQEFLISSFANDTAGYIQYPKGPQNFVLERNNAPGVVVANASAQVTENSFYSLLLLGEANDENFRVAVLSEPDVRAEEGKAKVQIVHALGSVRSIVVNGTGFTLGPVDYGSTSGFVELPTGPQTLRLSTTDGRDLGSVSVTLAERGQVTVLVAGNLGDGVLVKRIYDDLN